MTIIGSGYNPYVGTRPVRTAGSAAPEETTPKNTTPEQTNTGTTGQDTSSADLLAGYNMILVSSAGPRSKKTYDETGKEIGQTFYDENGNITHQSTVTEWNEEGIATSWDVHYPLCDGAVDEVYKDGKLVSKKRLDEQGRETGTILYDENGGVKQQSTVTDWNADGIAKSWNVSYPQEDGSVVTEMYVNGKAVTAEDIAVQEASRNRFFTATKYDQAYFGNFEYDENNNLISATGINGNGEQLNIIYNENGKLFNGINEADGKYYENGIVHEGIANDGKCYVDGEVCTGPNGGKMYLYGEPFTGTYGNTYYQNGEPFSGLCETDGLYYQNGELYTGETRVNKFTAEEMEANGWNADTGRKAWFINGKEVSATEYVNYIMEKAKNNITRVNDGDSSTKPIKIILDKKVILTVEEALLEGQGKTLAS